MPQSKENWNVKFHTFLTHVRHDLKKGLYNQTYKWDNITLMTDKDGNTFKCQSGSIYHGHYALEALGTEENHSEDNLINHLTKPDQLSKMVQQTSNIAHNVNNDQEIKPMTNTNTVVNNVTSTLKTVASQIADSAKVSAKMEAGENILLALRNIVMAKAGFMQKVKFKFAPIALDVAVVLGADILVAELLPEKKSAKLAVECLNLAMTKEILHALPIKDFTNALTGGDAFKQLQAMTDNS